MELIHRNVAGTAFFLSDGYITMAVRLYRLEDDGRTGINHFGFQVDDIAAISRKIIGFDAEIEEPKKRPADRPYAEFRGCDTETNGVDLSEHGLECAESDVKEEKAPEKALA